MLTLDKGTSRLGQGPSAHSCLVEVAPWCGAVPEVSAFEPPPGPPGVLICNPPYGERIGEEKELKGLYRALGEVFRERCLGWTLWVFTGNAFLARQIGEPAQVIDLFNGKIPCRLLRYELV